MQNLSLDILLALISLSGFFLAFFIYRKKREPAPLICPLKSDCNVVIKSHYSKFLGIPIEILGMVYYSLTFLAHLLVILSPSLVLPGTVFFYLVASTIAFLFSLYLLAIQAFAIKQWCFWCLLSAVFCSALFLLTVLNSPFTFLSLLHSWSSK